MLTIWKRHSATCAAQLAKNKKVAADQRRFFKNCQCACWITGVHPTTKEYVKEALGTTSWEVAEKLKAARETKGAGEIKGEKITIAEAFDTWFADKRRVGTSESTLYTMYGALRTTTLAFAKDKGLVLLSQLNDDRTYELVLGWTNWKRSTAARQLSNLRSFFAFTDKRWTTGNPAKKIDTPKSPHVPVSPFTPEEEDRILDALDTWTEETRTNSGAWSLRPATLKCLVHVFEDTGLRTSDALRVRPEILEPLPNGGASCTLVQIKGDRYAAEDATEVTVYLREATVRELNRVPRISAKYPFMPECERESNPDAFREHLHLHGRAVYATLKFMVGKVANVENCRPHRFRHTFAVKKLVSGWRIEDVSKLLGHKKVGITEKYYAKWTKGRQDRLRDMVSQEWNEGHSIPQVRRKRGGPRAA